MLEIKNVLVATDFSECSTTALECARGIAHAFGARLHVMHVAEPPVTEFLTPGARMPVINTVSDERHLLDTSVTDEDRQALRAKLIFVRDGTAADSIAEYAKQRHIDLVVLGTHGRRGLTHAIVGSVAERVIRLATCPVLTVRAHQRQFVEPETPAQAS